MHPELVTKERILAIRFLKSEYKFRFHFLKSEKSMLSLVSNLKILIFVSAQQIERKYGK